MADINDLAQQIAFYQAGGGRPKPMESFNNAFTSMSSIGDKTLSIIKDTIAAKKTALEANKLQIENTPILESVGTPRLQTALGEAQAAPIPAADLISGRLDTYGQSINSAKQKALDLQKDVGTLTPTQYATAKLGGLRDAQTDKIVSDPTRQTMGQLFPTLNDAALQSQFGNGITSQTPYVVALGMGKLNIQKLRSERMFPIASLSQEGQAAARAAGMPDFIPESTARIINGANPMRLPTYEEANQVTTAASIQDKINQVYSALPNLENSALGFGKYQINKLGQYIPFMASDPAVVEFYTNINSINNAIVYLMSGKQINEQEAKRIKSELLEPELNPDAFRARLATVMHNFDYVRNLKSSAITNVGKRDPMPGGGGQSSPAGQPNNSPASSGSGGLDTAEIQKQLPAGAKIKSIRRIN